MKIINSKEKGKVDGYLEQEKETQRTIIRHNVLDSISVSFVGRWLPKSSSHVSDTSGCCGEVWLQLQRGQRDQWGKRQTDVPADEARLEGQRQHRVHQAGCRGCFQSLEKLCNTRHGQEKWRVSGKMGIFEKKTISINKASF